MLARAPEVFCTLSACLFKEKGEKRDKFNALTMIYYSRLKDLGVFSVDFVENRNMRAGNS